MKTLARIAFFFLISALVIANGTAAQEKEPPAKPTLLLRNLSSKNVAAVRIDVFADGKQRLSSMPQGEHGQPLIKPGAVFERWIIAAQDVLMKQEGYKPKPAPSQSFVIRTVVFDDGSHEGEPEPAAHFAALQVGNRTQLRRAIAALEKPSDSPDLRAYEAIAKLRRDVAALSTDLEPSVIDELEVRFPTLDQREKSNLGTSVVFSLHSVRKQLVADIERLRKSLKQSADETEFRVWLAETTEKYKQWLSRL